MPAAAKCGSQVPDESDEVGLAWDTVCFLVLLVQRRLFMSYMFQHVVNEYKAQSALAARGAEIFRKIISQKVIDLSFFFLLSGNFLVHT